MNNCYFEARPRVIQVPKQNQSRQPAEAFSPIRLQQYDQTKCKRAQKQRQIRNRREIKEEPNGSRLLNCWGTPRKDFRPAHEVSGRRASRQNFAIRLGVEGKYRPFIYISQRPGLSTIVSGAHRPIKNRHLSRDFFEDKKRSLPPDSVIIEPIKRAERRDIAAELSTQLRRNRVFPVHQIVRIEAESSIMVGHDRFLNLGAKGAMNTRNPLPGIGNRRTVSEIVTHLVANQIGMNGEKVARQKCLADLVVATKKALW